MVSLITYDEDGRPVGIQAVTLQTNGTFLVEGFDALTYERDEPDEPTDAAAR